MMRQKNRKGKSKKLTFKNEKKNEKNWKTKDWRSPGPTAASLPPPCEAGRRTWWQRERLRSPQTCRRLFWAANRRQRNDVTDSGWRASFWLTDGAPLGFAVLWLSVHRPTTGSKRKKWNLPAKFQFRSCRTEIASPRRKNRVMRHVFLSRIKSKRPTAVKFGADT